MYIRTCIVVVHLWGRLSVVQVVRHSPFKSAWHVEIETPSIGSIERVVSVTDILPYYFRLVNTAALFIEGPLQLYSAQHSTAQNEAIFSTPNPTTAQLAGGKRSHDGNQPGTLCGQRALLRHARRAIVLSILFIRAASRLFCFSR